MSREGTIIDRIDDAIRMLDNFRTTIMSAERARSASVTITHLETAKLWAGNTFKGLDPDPFAENEDGREQRQVG